MAVERDQEFLEFIVKSIVSKPEEVSVERKVDERGVLLTLKVSQDDIGYVIGRRGQTAQAVRHLLKAVGIKNDARVNLKIHDPEGDRRRASRDNSEEVDTSSVDDLKI